MAVFLYLWISPVLVNLKAFPITAVAFTSLISRKVSSRSKPAAGFTARFSPGYISTIAWAMFRRRSKSIFNRSKSHPHLDQDGNLRG